MKRLALVGMLATGVWTGAAHAQTDGGAPPAVTRPSAPLLEPTALEALVAGVAFYPDALVEQILDAAQDPATLHAAAQGEPGSYSASVQALQQMPDLLKQLDSHLAATARLGLAAKTQLNDVWNAIDRVRSAAAANQATSEETATTDDGATAATAYPTYPAYPAYGAFAAGLWADNVMDQVRRGYYTHNGNVYGGAARVYGANGVATGAGVAGAAVQGNTTYYGAAGAATVNTYNGGSYSAAGKTAGSVTRNETSGSYNRSAAGGVVNNNTGNYAAGTRSSDGAYHQNSDGSYSFSRDASTRTQSSYGNSQIEHSGSGTYTGDGTGSYQGSTDINSTHGNASTSTTYQDGQLTTDVDTARGSKTYTAGDGEVQNKPSTSAREGARQFQRPSQSGLSGQHFSRPGGAQGQAFHGGNFGGQMPSFQGGHLGGPNGGNVGGQRSFSGPSRSHSPSRSMGGGGRRR